jgi:hypothetical protein
VANVNGSFFDKLEYEIKYAWQDLEERRRSRPGKSAYRQLVMVAGYPTGATPVTPDGIDTFALFLYLIDDPHDGVRAAFIPIHHTLSHQLTQEIRVIVDKHCAVKPT